MVRGLLQTPFDADAPIYESGEKQREVSYLEPPQWPDACDLIPEEDVSERERQSED